MFTYGIHLSLLNYNCCHHQNVLLHVLKVLTMLQTFPLSHNQSSRLTVATLIERAHSVSTTHVCIVSLLRKCLVVYCKPKQVGFYVCYCTFLSYIFLYLYLGQDKIFFFTLPLSFAPQLCPTSSALWISSLLSFSVSVSLYLSLSLPVCLLHLFSFSLTHTLYLLLSVLSMLGAAVAH